MKKKVSKGSVSVAVAKASTSKKHGKVHSNNKRIDLNSLDASFSELQRTKMTKSAAEASKAAKIVSVKGKILVPSRETVSKTSDDLAQLLKDF